MHKYLSIGETAKRCDVAASTLRFYESKGLIQSERGTGNQRRFHRSMLRRISVIRVAQTLGLTLSEISASFAGLPDHRTPNKRDWQRLSTQWAKQLDQRIHRLQSLRDNLTSCIGCGCLSLKACGLYNRNDEVSKRGPGPQILFAEDNDEPEG